VVRLQRVAVPSRTAVAPPLGALPAVGGARDIGQTRNRFLQVRTAIDRRWDRAGQVRIEAQHGAAKVIAVLAMDKTVVAARENITC
jgi:hypothetical protein